MDFKLILSGNANNIQNFFYTGIDTENLNVPSPLSSQLFEVLALAGMIFVLLYLTASVSCVPKICWFVLYSRAEPSFEFEIQLIC